MKGDRGSVVWGGSNGSSKAKMPDRGMWADGGVSDKYRPTSMVQTGMFRSEDAPCSNSSCACTEA